MKPERWRQISQLFHSALEHEGDRRADFLARACDGDDGLRAEVESLIASHERADGFIEAPASDVAAEMFAGEQNRLQAGRRLGRYTVTALLGAGGMGLVYLAEDKQLGREVAIKVLNERFKRDESNLQRFVREAQAASALNHPNILVIHEIGSSDGAHYIVSEYVRGRTLRELLSERTLRLSEILDIAAQIAGALSAAHDAGLVHRDIKPENIMIRPDGFVKILDFGLAKLVREKALRLEESATERNQTAQGVILGTVNYMSPEQAKGGMVDERTDIFSLGALVYEMIAGRTPFDGDSALETLANLINSEPPPLSHFATGLPDGLQQIVARTLRKNAAERYQTMADLHADFRDLRENLTFEEKLERRGGVPVSANRRTDEQNGFDHDGDQTRISKPVNAYQAYQLARYHLTQLSPPDITKSGALLREALRFDPDFAPAHAALAEQMVQEGITGLRTPAESFPKAKDALRRAAALNPQSAEFYAAAGLVDFICDWNFTEAERNLREALRLNSHYAFANNYLGQVFMLQSRPEEAEFYLRRSVEIDPMGLYNRICLTIAYFLGRSYQKVIEECEQMLAVYPRFIIAWWKRCWALEQTGRAAEAVVEYEKILREPEGELVRRWMGYAYALVGDREKALDTAARVEAERQARFVSPSHLAALYGALNETDKAFFYLEQGLAERDPWMLWIGADPRFDNLRSDARFDEMVRRVGLK